MGRCHLGPLLRANRCINTLLAFVITTASSHFRLDNNMAWYAPASTSLRAWTQTACLVTTVAHIPATLGASRSRLVLLTYSLLMLGFVDGLEGLCRLLEVDARPLTLMRLLLLIA